MVYKEKTHLVDRYWQDLANRFNAAMKFETEEDLKNGTQQKNPVSSMC